MGKRVIVVFVSVVSGLYGCQVSIAIKLCELTYFDDRVRRRGVGGED